MRFLILVAVLLSLLSTATAFVPARGGGLREETEENISNDELAGEDMYVRLAALRALGTAAGTVVVMNARSGRIYTIVNQEWAIHSGFKPCSTIKLVTGVAGYGENVIARDGRLRSQEYRLGLDEALAYSNNTFFQKIGKELGNEKFIEYARELGLGEPTGLNVPDEYKGKLPVGNENLRIYSHADDFEVTPLQLSVLVSALTNGGRLVVPRIARTRSEKTSFRGYLRRDIGFRPFVFERVIPGMSGAVGYGTAKRIRRGLGVAGKTGSCISKGTWIGLFASVAPIEDPVFSVVVITRGKRARGKYAAAIAGEIYEALEPRFGERSNTLLLAANRPQLRDRRGRADVKKDRVKEVVRRRAASTRSNRPLVKKTSSQRPAGTRKPQRASERKSRSVEEMFPTIVITGGKREIKRPRVVENN